MRHTTSQGCGSHLYVLKRTRRRSECQAGRREVSASPSARARVFVTNWTPTPRSAAGEANETRRVYASSTSWTTLAEQKPQRSMLKGQVSIGKKKGRPLPSTNSSTSPTHVPRGILPQPLCVNGRPPRYPTCTCMPARCSIVGIHRQAAALDRERPPTRQWKKNGHMRKTSVGAPPPHQDRHDDGAGPSPTTPTDARPPSRCAQRAAPLAGAARSRAASVATSRLAPTAVSSRHSPSPPCRPSTASPQLSRRGPASTAHVAPTPPTPQSPPRRPSPGWPASRHPAPAQQPPGTAG